MQFDDLGPLSKAIVEAVLAAEQLGIAPDAGLIWRTLPGYDTHLANVQAAVAADSSLRGWLHESGGLFCALDREALPGGMAASRRRALALRDRVRPSLAGLGKLPMVEAVAVFGASGWGHRPTEDGPVDLMVIAEGGRTELVRRAIAAWRRSKGEIGSTLRLSVLIDADVLDGLQEDAGSALALATLRPVSNEAAWRELRAASPALASRHPNARLDAPELMVWSATGGRLEGRLASLRRNLVPGSDAHPLLRSNRRRPGPLGRLEGLLRTRRSDPQQVGPLLGAAFDEALTARRTELMSWTPEVGSAPEPPRDRTAATAEPRPLEVAPDGERDDDPLRGRSRRRRGPIRRASRARSAASPEGGQRSRRKPRRVGPGQ